MLVQCRVAESLCVLAYFTPAAVPGLTLGCAVFNLTCSGALPLDILVGSLATFLSTKSMYFLRPTHLGRFLGLFLPALFNGILVGWELTVFLGSGFSPALFWSNALFVATGEAIVLLGPGSLLLQALTRNGLGIKILA